MYLGTGTGRALRRLCDDGELDVIRRHQAMMVSSTPVSALMN
jgi:hypothetical protein